MLQAIGLTKSYGDHAALLDLNLSIKQGEIYCLLGQNGAGKTTTINLFLGFIPANSGTVSVNGIAIKPGGADYKKHLAYIPEVVMLYGNLTATENLDFFSRLAGFRYQTNELITFLSRAGLQQEAHMKNVASFSKGMRQKVGIAIALAKNAEALLMDEPTSGLDPKATAEFTEICRQLSSQGKAILMATHDIFNAVNLGSRIGIMKSGRLVHTLAARDISAVELQQLYLETI